MSAWIALCCEASVGDGMCGQHFTFTAASQTTVAQARTAAAAHGWTHAGGRDRCPGHHPDAPRPRPLRMPADG